MNCSDTERLLELRAAELLSGDDAHLLDAHLLECERCRGASDSLDGLLDAARLPPLTSAEEKRLSELSLIRPVRRQERPVLRWAAISAAVAASALIGLHFGNAGAPPTHRSTPQLATRGATPRSQPARAVSGSDPAADGSLDVLASLDTTDDSALYDAVAFQGGTMPFDLDNE